jgi:hypothetical protein
MFHVLQLIDNNTTDGELSLIDLLTNLCSDISLALGGVNSFEPFIEEETNTIKIVDQIPLPDKKHFLDAQTLPATPAYFDVFGYNGKVIVDKEGNTSNITTAGFIREFSFQTTITNNLATMLTVGATANGYVVGQDSTALSRMNDGLEDRFKIEINHTGSANADTANSRQRAAL